ncbi:MAG: tetratricopeptide repeat protein, partial [Nannocystaceae bacterium]|nr:tetratricopeptide repeat protein [Nannocystaceae bacterium]
ATALAAAKAVFFVLLGGAIATLAVFASRGEPRVPQAGSEGAAAPSAGAVVDDSANPDDPGLSSPHSDGGRETPETPGVAPERSTPDLGAGDPEIVIDPADDEPIIDDAAPPAVPPPALPATVPQLVVEAEVALEADRYREPVETSMAVAMNTLALRDPGNEALARLRRAARDKLVPVGEAAVAGKRWAEAVHAYRDLLAVWPGHPARADLIDALHQQGRVVYKHEGWEAALSTADELLNYDDEDFRAYMLRGDALSKLARHTDARDAYSRAVKLKPRSKIAKKKRARAARKARRSQTP